MDIYLLSHTEVYNPNQVLLGQSDLPLEENFTNTFSWLSDILSPLGEPITYITNSSRRCIKLASSISKDKYIVDDNFSEINLGDFELYSASKISKNEYLDYIEKGFPNGENINDVKKRIRKGLKKIASRSGSYVVITSPNIIRFIILQCLKVSLKNIGVLEIDHGSISKLKYDNKSNTFLISFININKNNIK